MPQSYDRNTEPYNKVRKSGDVLYTNTSEAEFWIMVCLRRATGYSPEELSGYVNEVMKQNNYRALVMMPECK